jgi:hypothetical protein
VKSEDLPKIKVLSALNRQLLSLFLLFFEEFRYRITSSLRRAFFTHFYALKIEERLKCEVLFSLFETLKSIILPEEKIDLAKKVIRF